MTAARPIDPELARRLMADMDSRIDRSGDCWLWRGTLTTRGYGNFRRYPTHRVAYVAAHGCDVPGDLVIDHLCRVRSCLNPAHLDVTTRGDNVLRSPESVTGAKVRWTHCPAGHAYDDENTLYRRGRWRRCRTCENAGKRRRRAEALARQ
jgi:hypothetical protein